MAQQLDYFEQQDLEPDFKAIFFRYLRFWPWFLAALSVTLVVAWVYIQKTAPQYQTEATLLIKDEKKSGVRNAEALRDLDIFSGSKAVDNEIEVLKSRVLLEKVVEELNLTVNYFTEGKYRDHEIYDESPISVRTTKVTGTGYEKPFFIKSIDEQKFELLSEEKKSMGTFVYTQNIKSEYGEFRVFINKDKPFFNEPVKIRLKPFNKVVEGLRNDITIGLSNKNSTVLNITYPGPVPDKGKAVLNKLLEVYSFSALEDKNREATNTLRFIEDRLKLVTEELSDKEQDVERYKSSAGITDLSTEANLFLEKVKDNDIKLSELDIQMRVLEGVERYVSTEGATNIAPATLMVSDPVLTSHIETLNSLELQKEKVSKGARAGNPFLETLNSQISNTKQAIQDNLASQKRNLAITRSGLQANNYRMEGAIRSIPRKEREFVGIQRQANIKENLYLILLQKREETALSYASTVTDSRVVDVPFTKPTPIAPKTKIIYLAALLLGFVLPIGYVYTKDLLTDTVQSKKEIEQVTGLTIFGEIAKREKAEDTNFLDPKSRSFVAEQFRTLRTNLQYLNANETGAKIIMLTSSLSGEGKTFISLNLAVSLAQLDKKVLLVELDLRKPKLTRYLGLKPLKGLTHYLTNQAKEDEIFTKTPFENLFLLSSGPTPPNPSELIAGEKLKELLNIYKKSFDYIIMDLPPVGLVADATILAPVVDTCFFVVRHEFTPKNHLNSLRELSKKGFFKSMHVIFNDVNYKNSREYGYGYGSYYGYGTYSYEEGAKRKRDFWKVWK